MKKRTMALWFFIILLIFPYPLFGQETCTINVSNLTADKYQIETSDQAQAIKLCFDVTSTACTSFESDLIIDGKRVYCYDAWKKDNTGKHCRDFLVYTLSEPNTHCYPKWEEGPHTIQAFLRCSAWDFNNYPECKYAEANAVSNQITVNVVNERKERITKPTVRLLFETCEVGKSCCFKAEATVENPQGTHEFTDIQYKFSSFYRDPDFSSNIYCDQFDPDEYVQVRAYCPLHNVYSERSDLVSFRVLQPQKEGVTRPDELKGPSKGKVRKTYTFTSGGSKSTEGHQPIEYNFDWNDRTYSGWGGPTASKSWSAPIDSAISVRARCSEHENIRSSPMKKYLNIIEGNPPWEEIKPPRITNDWFIEFLIFWLYMYYGNIPADQQNGGTGIADPLNQTPAWAAGYDNQNKKGVLLRYNNRTWENFPLPYVSSDWNLKGVDFLSATEGWAVGKDIANKRGVMLRYTSDSWSVVTPPSVSSDWELTAIQFTSSTEGWAVGYDNTNKRGVLLRYSNGSWSIGTLPYVSANWEIRSLHFISPSEGWAVGYDIAGAKGIILRYQNNTWSLITPPNVSANWDLSGIHFTSSDEGWAIGSDYVNHRGVLIHFLNGNWTSVTPPSVSTDWNLRAVHFRHPEEGWAVGYDATNKRGVMLWYSGDSWDLNTPPEVSSDWELTGIRLSEKGEAWAVGNDKQNKQGVLLRMVPPPEAVLPPDPPVGPETGNIGTSYTYIAAGARSTYNHPLEYQIDWKGDGTDITSWGSQELTKVFSSSGTYDIKTRARCAWDTTIESDWSEPLSVTISSSPGIQPIPDIKANGSDGPISVSQRNPLSITISLNSGDRYGQNADWWILVSTSAGPYSYHVGNSWTPGVSTVYQGPLMDLAYAEVLNISGLPTGTYTFYFGVDLNMNGSLDMDKLYYDSVNVTITP